MLRSSAAPLLRVVSVRRSSPRRFTTKMGFEKGATQPLALLARMPLMRCQQKCFARAPAPSRSAASP
jgi:hypothetical protein